MVERKSHRVDRSRDFAFDFAISRSEDEIVVTFFFISESKWFVVASESVVGIERSESEEFVFSVAKPVACIAT